MSKNLKWVGAAAWIGMAYCGWVNRVAVLKNVTEGLQAGPGKVLYEAGVPAKFNFPYQMGAAMEERGYVSSWLEEVQASEEVHKSR